MDLHSSLKSPGYPLSSVLFLSQQHFRGKRFPAAPPVKLSLQSPKRRHSQPAFISVRTQSSKSFSARARYSESVSISIYSKLFATHISVKKIIRVPAFLLLTLRNEVSEDDCIFVFNLRFGEFNLKKELSTRSRFLNSWLLLAASVFASLRYYVIVDRLRFGIW